MKSNKITTATTKAIQLVEEGNTEVWSASLGDLTKNDMLKVQVELNKKGITTKTLKNSMDHGLVVVVR